MLLMRLLYTTFVLRLWFVVPVMAIVAWEFYCRHEARIRALRMQPSIVIVPKAKARKAVA